MLKESCANCRFWDVYDEASDFYDNINPGAIGDCRRRAPRISDELLRRTLPGYSCEQTDALANNLYVPSAFPITALDSWCGEYEQQREAA